MEPEVEEGYFSLKPYELYVSKPEDQLKLSNKARVDVVTDPGHTGEGAESDTEKLMAVYAFGTFKMISLARLDPGEWVMTEPVRVGLKVKDIAKSESAERCAAMIGLLINGGYLNSTMKDTFRPDLRYLLETIHPRARTPASSYNEFAERLSAKVMMNAFGPLGEWNSVLLHYASYFNHSCVPNVVMTSTQNNSLTFSTCDSVGPGQELFISYWLFPIDSLKARAENYNSRFQCNCEACAPDSKRHPSVHWANLNEQLPMQLPSHCWYCGDRTAPLHCKRCKKSRYCSRECLSSNYKVHKLICARIA
jgi:hypothetical protein